MNNEFFFLKSYCLLIYLPITILCNSLAREEIQWINVHHSSNRDPTVNINRFQALSIRIQDQDQYHIGSLANINTYNEACNGIANQIKWHSPNHSHIQKVHFWEWEAIIGKRSLSHFSLCSNPIGLVFQTKPTPVSYTHLTLPTKRIV